MVMRWLEKMDKEKEVTEEENDAYRSKCLNLLYEFDEFVDNHEHLTGWEKAKEKYRFQEVLNRINRKPDGRKILFRG